MTSTARHQMHPELAARLERIHAKSADIHAEERYAELGLPLGPAEAWDLVISDRYIPGPGPDIPVRIYHPTGTTSAPRPALLWLHGGAWVGGDLDMPEAHETARGVAGRADAVVVSVDYRLCSEQVHFPAPHDDVVAAFRWVRETAEDLGVAPERVAIGGASAGANLAAGAALRMRDDGDAPWQVLLLYPLVHCPIPEPYEELSIALEQLPEQLRLDNNLLNQVVTLMLDGVPIETASPYLFPGHTERLAGFPPTYIDNDEFDPLRSSGELFADQLRTAGVEVEQVLSPGVPHGHLNLVGLDAAHASLDRMAARLKRSGR